LKRFVFLSLSLLLLILIPSCVIIQPPATSTTPQVGTLAVIGTFSSNPATVNSGGTSNLLWNVTGATSVSIDQGIGQVDVAGTKVVSPPTTTVYTISATNSAGTVTRSATIMVNSAPPAGMPPVIGTFSSNLNSDNTSTLSWNVTGADLVSIDQGIGIVNAAGTKVISPATSAIYTLTATYAKGNTSNDIGTVTRSVTVTASPTSNTPWVH
jgi:hypothetical protein